MEFIVRRDIFLANGRFQNFDLAWGSDFISWVKFADAAGGIETCEKANVVWRKSNENISPDKSIPVLIRKIHSLTDNAKWLSDFAERQGYGNKWFYTKYPLGEIMRNKKLLSKEQKRELLDAYKTKIKPSFIVSCIVFWLKHI